MSRTQISLWTLGIALGGLTNAVWADEPQTAAQPKAAEAAPTTKPSKHAKHAKADAGAPATTQTTQTAEHKAAAGASETKHKHSPGVTAAPPVAAAPVQPSTPTPRPAKPLQPAAAVAKPAAPSGPTCSLEEPEQPRGGRLDVLGSGFGQAPVVRIANRPARQLERRSDRISVQVPVDSDGGAVTLQDEGKTSTCGKLVIIGKNR